MSPNIQAISASCLPFWKANFHVSTLGVRKLTRSGRPSGKPLQDVQIVTALSESCPAFKTADLNEQVQVLDYLKGMDTEDETGESEGAVIEEVDPWIVPLMSVFRWRSDGNTQRGYYHKPLAKHLSEGGAFDDPSVVRELTPMTLSDDTCLATALMSDPNIWVAFEEMYKKAVHDPNTRVTPRAVKDGVRYYWSFRSYLKLMQSPWQSDIRFHIGNEPGSVSNNRELWSYWHFGPYTHPCLNEPAGPTPTWDGWLAKLGHPDRARAFRAWVFGVCLAKNKSRQVLWLEGPGGDGKGTVANVLSQFLGEKSSTTVSEDIFSNSHGSSAVYGHRLLIHPDCKNPRFLSYALVHQITGGDRILINPKFGQMFSEKMDSKMMVLANCPPDMDVYNMHESTRMLYFFVNPNAKGADKSHLARGKSRTQLKGDVTFEARLLAEMPQLLAKGAQDYRDLCPTHGNIVLPDTIVNDIADRCASVEQERFEKFYDDTFDMDVTQWSEVSLVKEAFDRSMPPGSRGSMQYQSFVKFLEAKGHRKVRTMDDSGKRYRGFLGLKPKGASGHLLSSFRVPEEHVGLEGWIDETESTAPRVEGSTGTRQPDAAKTTGFGNDVTSAGTH